MRFAGLASRRSSLFFAGIERRHRILHLVVLERRHRKPLPLARIEACPAEDYASLAGY